MTDILKLLIGLGGMVWAAVAYQQGWADPKACTGIGIICGLIVFHVILGGDF
jgi:hypothetical protein